MQFGGSGPELGLVEVGIKRKLCDSKIPKVNLKGLETEKTVRDRKKDCAASGNCLKTH